MVITTTKTKQLMWHPRVNIPQRFRNTTQKQWKMRWGGWRKEDNLCVVSSRIWTLAVDTRVRIVKGGGI